MSKARDLANAGTALTTVSATELGYLDGVTSAVQTQLDAKIAKSTVTAKGDLIVGTGSGVVTAQAVGTDGQFLQAASAQADGVQWASAVTSVSGTSGRVTSSGGTTPALDLDVSGVAAGTYGSASLIPSLTVDTYGRITSASTNALSAGGITLLSTTNLSGTSVTISSISQSYTNLMILINGPVVNTAAVLVIRPNNSNNVSLSGTNASTGGGFNNIGIRNPANANDVGITANNAQQVREIIIDNYANATYGKPFQFRGSGSGLYFNTGGIINETAAITSLVITTGAGTSTFTAGQVLVYGVK